MAERSMYSLCGDKSSFNKSKYQQQRQKMESKCPRTIKTDLQNHNKEMLTKCKAVP